MSRRRKRFLRAVRRYERQRLRRRKFPWRFYDAKDVTVIIDGVQLVDMTWSFE